MGLSDLMLPQQERCLFIGVLGLHLAGKVLWDFGQVYTQTGLGRLGHSGFTDWGIGFRV